jgi:hypothetical protein
VARRPIWLINMADGTWSVCCMVCRLPLYRGTRAGAERAAANHDCEPVLHLGRRHRRPA